MIISCLKILCMHAKSPQSCLILCSLVDRHPPGTSVHGFSRQEYWSGLSCPPPRDLPDPGIEPSSLTSPQLAGGLFYHWCHQRSPFNIIYVLLFTPFLNAYIKQSDYVFFLGRVHIAFFLWYFFSQHYSQERSSLYIFRRNMWIMDSIFNQLVILVTPVFSVTNRNFL